MKKAKLWAHATYEMVEHDEFCKKLNLPAYVRAENYDFIHQRSENVEAENARLKEAIADSYKAVDEMEKRFKELEAEFEMHPMAVEIVRLKAEVERLKSLCDCLGMGGKHTITELDAKEGKHS